MLKSVANALLFQIGWFACVLGGNSYWLLIAVAVLVTHFLWISSWAAEGRLVITVTLVGVVLDSVLMTLGVFDFGISGYVLPLWLALLWAVMATTLNHCLAGPPDRYGVQPFLALSAARCRTMPARNWRRFTFHLECGRACCCWGWSGQVFFPCCNG